MLRNTLAAALLFVPAFAMAQTDAAPKPTTPPATERYVDAVHWPAHEAGMERFENLTAHLSDAFKSICGDTFCEGDYGNLQPMELRCSVDSTKGTMKQCLWTFAGSFTQVNGKSGAVQVNAKLFKCKLALAKDTPVESFYEALMSSKEPLEVKLPMNRKSVFDGLNACL
ncbi:MAG TPA: hypothetical protein VM621_17875 [Luteibacter sp.]|uniref:hypothetical protein n=1 Tax=Luteibacter sp. TaxID=1886636 RepID=UPI002CAEF721|nr:hypothetical protein [Luteibacter sp.]HVI56913.1 hypothetical protein [Luteibacter sp.]